MVGDGEVPPGCSPGQVPGVVQHEHPSLLAPLTPSSSDGLSAGNRGLIPTKPVFASHPSNAAAIKKDMIFFRRDTCLSPFV